MSRKTVKEIDVQFNLMREDFEDMKKKFDVLADKYATLEKKYEECLMSRKNTAFKCNSCDNELENKKDLQRHRKNHHLTNGSLQCAVCDKLFDLEWKLNAHMKNHKKKYSCDYCEKTFRYEDTKDKHTKITHENLKLFCHYFNNKKDCPFNDECVFLHEDSDDCKYGEVCERELCMFKHEINDEKSESKEDNDDEEENGEFDNADKTFVNPFLQIVEDSSCDTVEKESNKDSNLKSDKSVTESNVTTIEPKYKHRCVETFTSKKKLKSHDYRIHSGNYKTMWDLI